MTEANVRQRVNPDRYDLVVPIVRPAALYSEPRNANSLFFCV